MRDQNRIKAILQLLETIWKLHPNLRLTQIIGNCFSAGDLYYVEDELLEKELKKTYLKGLDK